MITINTTDYRVGLLSSPAPLPSPRNLLYLGRQFKFNIALAMLCVPWNRIKMLALNILLKNMCAQPDNNYVNKALCNIFRNKLYRLQILIAGPRSINQNCIDKILPRLFLGNEEGALNKDTLLNLGFTHILCCTSSPRHYFPDSFTYKFIEIHDNQFVKIIFRFEEAYKFISSGIASGGVYIHCAAGISRSATLVIAYLMREYRVTYPQAYNFVASKRGCINPNDGFKSQLHYYDSTFDRSAQHERNIK